MRKATLLGLTAAALLAFGGIQATLACQHQMCEWDYGEYDWYCAYAENETCRIDVINPMTCYGGACSTPSPPPGGGGPGDDDPIVDPTDPVLSLDRKDNCNGWGITREVGCDDRGPCLLC